MNKTHLFIAAAIGAVAGYAFADQLATFPGYSNLNNLINPPSTSEGVSTTTLAAIGGASLLAFLIL